MNIVKYQLGKTLEQHSNEIIQEAYRFHQYNKSQTAKCLDISIRNLEMKLKKFAEDELAFKNKIFLDKLERRNLQARERGLPTLTAEQLLAEEQQERINQEHLEKERQLHEDYVARSRCNKIGIKMYGTT